MDDEIKSPEIRRLAKKITETALKTGYSDVVIFSEREAELFLNVGEDQLYYWRENGGGPVFFKYSDTQIAYSIDDLIAFADAHKHVTNAKSLCDAMDEYEEQVAERVRDDSCP